VNKSIEKFLVNITSLLGKGQGRQVAESDYLVNTQTVLEFFNNGNEGEEEEG
jgi:hypothetical protein